MRKNQWKLGIKGPKQKIQAIFDRPQTGSKPTSKKKGNAWPPF